MVRKSNNWVQVYTTSTEMDAYFIKGNLENEDIPARILSQVDTTRQFTVGGLAIVRIYVQKHHEEQAKEIIKEIESGENSLED